MTQHKRLQNWDVRASMAKPALQYLVIHGFAGAVGFLSYMLFSRLIPPADYAVYALLTATAGAATAFCYGWMGISIIRHFQSREVDQEIYISSIVIAFAGMSIVAILVQVLVPILWMSQLSSPLILVLSPLIAVFMGWFEISTQISRARLEVLAYGAKMIVRTAGLLSVGSLFVLLGWESSALLVASAGTFFAASLISIRRDLAGFALAKVSLRTMGVLFAYGWPLAACLGLSWIMSSSDRYLIYWLIGDRAAGEYALAYDLSRQPIWMLAMASSMATLPLAARAFEAEGEAAARKVLTQSLSVLLVVCLPMLLLQMLFAQDLAHLLFGERYRVVSAEIMPFVALGIFLHGFRGFYLDISIHLIRRTHLLVGMWVAAVVVNVLLNLAMLPRVGVIGAAYSTVLAHVFAIAYFLLFIPAPKVLGVNIADLGKISVAVAVFLTALYLPWQPGSQLQFLARIGLAGIAYLAALLYLNPCNLYAALGAAFAKQRPGGARDGASV